MSLITQIYEEVIVPPAVRDELLRADPQTPGLEELTRAFAENTIRMQAPSQQALVQTLSRVVDIGEAEAIALAVELDYLVLLDDRDARAEARRRGVLFTGTVGTLRDA